MQTGIDIQHVDAECIERITQSTRIGKIFTARELEYCSGKANETMMGLYCAKEAFFKAVGTGIKVSQLHDVEVRHEKLGAPYLLLSPAIIHEYNLNTAKIALSISHTKSVAVAVVIIAKLDRLI